MDSATAKAKLSAQQNYGIFNASVEALVQEGVLHSNNHLKYFNWLKEPVEEGLDGYNIITHPAVFIVIDIKKPLQICNGSYLNYLCKLSYQLQFINDIFCTAQFINTPQHITYIYTNGTVKVLVKCYLMT